MHFHCPCQDRYRGRATSVLMNEMESLSSVGIRDSLTGIRVCNHECEAQWPNTLQIWLLFVILITSFFVLIKNCLNSRLVTDPRSAVAWA